MTRDDNSFKNESSVQNYEWHRKRALREKRETNACSNNRVDWLVRGIQKKHGAKAVNEIKRELNSKERNRKKQYFT